MNTFLRSEEFAHWLDSFRDAKAKARILSRLDLAALGNFGDCSSVGEGISEMRIHYGPGYRVYYMRRGKDVFLLLGGGDKSTQARDIANAARMARDLKDEESRAKRRSKK